MEKSKMQDDHLYIFLHVPKCAGSTLAYHLEYNFPKEVLMPFYSTKFYNHILGRFEDITEPEYFQNYLSKLSWEQKRRIRFVYGHQAYYGIHKYFDRPCRYIIFFRNPVKRLVSEYYAYRRRYERKLPAVPWGKTIPPNLTFQEWFESDNGRVNNHMTQFLIKDSCGRAGRVISETHLETAKKILEQVFFVGITERAVEDLLYLYDHFRLTKYFENRNVTDRRDVILDPVLLEEVRLKNTIDQALYDYALALNRKQRTERFDYPIRIIKTRVKRFLAPYLHTKKDIRVFRHDYLYYLNEASAKKTNDR